MIIDRKVDDAEQLVKQEKYLKHRCETDGLYFTRYFFKEVLEGTKMIIAPHNKIIDWALQRVIDGKSKRLIINIPPGFFKTIQAGVAMAARSLAIEPRSRFLYLSYSQTLVDDCSAKVRSVVQSPQFQNKWGMKLKKDTQAKGLWKTDSHGELGARTLSGQVTGFRAGRLKEDIDPDTKYYGTMIIDDPNKPDDAFTAEREKVNNRFNNTIMSRLADDVNTPIVIIMQRIHDNDLCGYLLKGGSGERWEHLELPAYFEEREYPKEWTHGDPLDIPEKLMPRLDWPLWAQKVGQDRIDQLKHHNYTWLSQYQQRPPSASSGLFKESFFLDNTWNPDQPPPFEYTMIFVDTATKAKEHSDYTAATCWGFFEGTIYLIDILRGKWSPDECKSVLLAFFEKHANPHHVTARCRAAKVEDAAYGSIFLQQVAGSSPVPVEGITRTKDKWSRANDVSGFYSSGRLKFLPVSGHRHMPDLIEEHIGFTPDDTHAHDDLADTCFDAAEVMLFGGNDGTIGVW